MNESFEARMPKRKHARRSSTLEETMTAHDLFLRDIIFKNLDFNTNVQEALTFYPDESEFSNPIEYVKKIAPLAQPYGIAKIVPPKECALSTSLANLTSSLTEKQFEFTTKIQNIDQLQFRQRRHADNKRKFSDSPHQTKRVKHENPSRVIEYEPDPDEDTLSEFGFERNENEITLRSFKRMADTFKEDFFAKCLKHDPNYMLEQEAICYEQEETTLASPSTTPKARRRVRRSQGSSSPLISSPSQQQVNASPSPQKQSITTVLNATTTENKTLPRPVLHKLARRGGLKRVRGVTYFDSFESVTEDDIESEYWNTVDNQDQPITRKVTVQYGSDLDCTKVGSCFPKTWQYGWNMNKLPVLDDSVLKYLYQTIPGITSPMLYVGMLFSSFCWHVEDNHLYAINYIHAGANKTWYAIPGSAAQAFEKVMRNTMPDLFAIQPNLLHMLITMLSPRVLQQHNVPIYRMQHEAGTFIITYPRAYHAGFNHGFNVAESVNFSPGTWIPYGRICLNNYYHTHRPTAFAHDQIICTAATRDNISQFTKDMHDVITTELSLIVRLEERLRKHIHDELNITRLEGMPDSKKHPHRSRKVCIQKENKICLQCRQDCYISAIMIDTHPMLSSQHNTRGRRAVTMGMKAIQQEESESNEPFLCLKCAKSYLEKHNIQPSHCALVQRYTMQQLPSLLKDAQETTPKK
jgi:hypothetical protein